MKPILVVMLVVVVGVSSLFVSCVPTAPAQPAQEEPIKIGGLYSLTDFLAALGVDSHRATEVCLEQHNYEVLGRPIEFIAEDIASSPSVCLDKTRKLVETDGVSIIAGPILTSGADAIGPYLEQARVPYLLNSCITDEEALSGWPVWGHAGTLNQRCYTMGQFAYDELGYRKISTLVVDYLAGHLYMEGFMKGFTDRGGQIVQEQSFPFDTLDFTPYIVNLQDADALAVVVVGPVIQAFRQFREQGVWEKMPIICATDTGLFDEVSLLEVGQESIDTVGESHYHFSSTSPGNKEFSDIYESKYGVPPSSYGGMGYITMQIILDAIERSGGDLSFEALSKAISETDLETIRGRISFSPEGIGNTDTQIMEIVGPTTVETIAVYASKAVRVGDGFEVTVERIQ
ncbi:MAG: ABC transporter substrate-binding protein [Dehalococcoidales bacterium]|nr:ABC transporter substrate-binding protein [Dehalococcoidales bacterium]